MVGSGAVSDFFFFACLWNHFLLLGLLEQPWYDGLCLETYYSMLVDVTGSPALF